MNPAPAIAGLQHYQSLLRTTVATLGQPHYHVQQHPDLSPAGWHLGHCVFTDEYWIREVVLQDGGPTDELKGLYIPELSPKPARGGALPGYLELLEWAAATQAQNRALLASLLERRSGEHPLLLDGYLARFLIQHYAQHYETLQMVRMQHALRAFDAMGRYSVRAPLRPRRLSVPVQRLPAGHYRIGADPGMTAYDNELGAHEVALGPLLVGARPVSNAEYLAFMEFGGYEEPRLWSEAGWAWCSENAVTHPDHWRLDHAGHWFGVYPEGPQDLAPAEAVEGLSRYEAEAFARWADARLPHEAQWEAACRAGLLEGRGRVWEWCENLFSPYPGFRAFPYDGYSCPYFDNDHYVLRGGSRHTCEPVRRPSFRNYYQPDKRHIFAGVRLTFPA